MSDLTLGDFARSLEGIESSAVFAQLFHVGMTDPNADATPLLQLGAAIMMDKPILVIVLKDREADVPAKLRQFADRLVVVPDLTSAESVNAIAQAIDGLRA